MIDQTSLQEIPSGNWHQRIYNHKPCPLDQKENSIRLCKAAALVRSGECSAQREGLRAPFSHIDYIVQDSNSKKGSLIGAFFAFDNFY